MPDNVKLTLIVLAALAAAAALSAQGPGTVRGRVALADRGAPLHHADVLIPKLGRKTDTDADGAFEFRNVPPGTWEVYAHMHNLSDQRRPVVVSAGGVATVDFSLSLSPVREEITVTASGREETALETFLSVVSVGSLDLAGKSGSTSLGDLLDNQTGVAKRSFGPGTTRPVVRGFDGDRVLVLEDGVRTGSLSAQSGDHGEPIDPAMVERVEVVRGPATLLYGSNAIGGVVNAISPQHDLHEKPHSGPSGSATATGGSANAQGGGGANLRYGLGNWQLWGGYGGMRTGDYASPLGTIHNSHTKLNNGRFGVGRFAEKYSWNFGYALQDGRYGIPVDDVDLAYRRHQTRFTGTLRDIAFLENITLKLNYTDWTHRELEGAEVGTRFSNKQFIYRGEFQEKRRGIHSGTFGVWGLSRDFKSEGAEALSPPVQQSAFALFGLRQFDFERVRVQVGARVENNHYSPQGLRERGFTGFSGSAGVNVPTWRGGALVATLTQSYRAPSLEEIYFNGPHAGTGLFEVGNLALNRERSLGQDASIRHQSRKLRGELSFFHYRITDFVYYAPTGKFEDGLPEADVAQANSRYLGSEARVAASIREKVWLNLGFDSVSARLTKIDTPLPRIPPIRGRIGLDINHKGLSVKPELVLANHQRLVFPIESPTAGYVVPNLSASYSVARKHALHVVTVNAFNLGDRLYRNHLSLIKQVAPEIGRGVRFNYTVHFY
jgi:iron complex outermembrane receptor protein